MKTLLRDMATRHYFQTPQRWTPDPDDAYDFGLVSKALKIAHKLRIPDLELVVSIEDASKAASTTFADLLHGISHPKRRLTATHA